MLNVCLLKSQPGSIKCGSLSCVHSTRSLLPSLCCPSYPLPRPRAPLDRITLAAEQQIRIEREAEGDRKTAVMHAEKELAVERIRSEKLIAEKQAQRDLHAIEDDMMVARLKSQADAAYHAASKQAEADKLLLTEDYLRLQQVCLDGN